MLILHIGSVANESGGVTSVARELCRWQLPGVEQRLLPTTRRRGRFDDLRLVLRAVLRIWRHGRHAVVHAHVTQGGFWREGVVLHAARLRGAGRVVHVHGSSFSTYVRAHPRLAMFVLGPASIVVTLSEEATQAVTWVRPTATVRLVHNTCDLPPSSDFAGGAERRDVVSFVGEVGHRKGVDLLLGAWAMIGPERRGWTLELVGPAESRMTAEMIKDAASRDPSITWTGHLPREAVLGRLATARLVVLPSRAEAFPMSLLEGMASGAIPVATEVGGVRRQIGDAGFVCRPEDPAALAGCLKQAILLASGPDGASASERAARRAEVTWSTERLQGLLLAAWAEAFRPARSPSGRTTSSGR